LHIENISNENLKKLLKNIFNEEMKEKFKNHPAAISIHHNWIGGLLEHTLEVVKYCKLSKEISPELDEDLLVTGALLHDIGKLEEMEMTTRIKGTNIGQFAGHIIIGSILVSNKIDELKINKELKDKLLHMITSHHGKVENGSAKEPMFPEAIALYHADEMSSKISEMLNFVRDNKNETESDFMPKWEKKKPVNIFLR
jgi:3'-5' exoribonuclease